MNQLSLAAYALAVTLLAFKYLLAVAVQGRHRHRQARFAYPEDARAFGGEHVETEDEPVLRAARLLRNDGESQPLFLALGLLYVSLGLGPTGAFGYFGTFVLARWAHALFMLRPRQPARTRAFGLGMGTLLVLAAHCMVVAFGRLG